MTLFRRPVTPADVGELMDLTVEGRGDTEAMANLQREGIAALHNILCSGPVAYLADEVGMGKTYQAMGLAAVIWNDDPTARILFISPRENLQRKWERDYRRFFAQNYRRRLGGGDDLVSSALFSEPVHRPTIFHTLRSWTPTVGRGGPTAAFLRHPAFTRPLHFTHEDAQDLDGLWERLSLVLHRAGLFDVERPDELLPDNAMELLQLTFARAANRLLASQSAGGAHFDLVIVDEAQCLRNTENQTNAVLHAVLEGQAAKWLFMSATPAHTGPRDIPTILNHYPRAGVLVDPALAEDLPALQEAVAPLMVRRTRRYLTNLGKEVSKPQYRDHDVERWAVADEDMTPLQSLAMGLVQKGLVDVVEEHGGQFKIGYLSCFESLSSSIRGAVARAGEEDAHSSDHWRAAGESADYKEDSPDSTFVDRLAGRFSATFKDRTLPHPKIEALVDRVARSAYGTDDVAGGDKTIVFTRRVSTVTTLRDRLTQRWIQSIERRAQRVWGTTLNWDQPPHLEAGVDLDIEPVDDVTEDHLPAEDSPFRQAMRPKGWLGRYLQTMEDTGRQNLLMEDGWISRICRDTGADPARVLAQIPDDLWARSWNHASHGSGTNTRRHRAERMRYLALHLVRDRPDILGLSGERAVAWQSAYETILHVHAEDASAHGTAEPEPRLISEETLWTAWDKTFVGTDLELPASDVATVPTADLAAELCRRQVARTVLRQILRLSDAVVDLYLADLQRDTTTAQAFVEYVASDDPGAKKLRREVANWLTHLRTIVDTSLDGAGASWADLARSETWDQLFGMSPVVGVTGGSGAQLTANRQFLTPSMPQVIVCTDTMKEGVDLHLFCDTVLHYGVAWTPGDLEQRVGRVDRYFSQIERRLRSEGVEGAKLHVGYPHVRGSLERGQVVRVRERQQLAEKLMDTSLVVGDLGGKSMHLDAPIERRATVDPSAFAQLDFPEVGRSTVAVAETDANAVRAHYTAWWGRLADALRADGWQVPHVGGEPPRPALTISRQGDSHDLEWSYDPPLNQYVLTLTDPAIETGGQFSGGRRVRLVGRRRTTQTFLQALVPYSGEDAGDWAIGHIVRGAAGEVPQPTLDAQSEWGAELEAVSSGGVEWILPHAARLSLDMAGRRHTVTVFAYDGGVRVVGTVADDTTPVLPVPDVADLAYWAHEQTDDLAFGYLDHHSEDGLVYGLYSLLGEMPAQRRRGLVEEVAWRADMWEARLTGGDVH